MNYAVSESVAHFRANFGHPDFKNALAQFRPAVASPLLFTRLTVAKPLRRSVGFATSTACRADCDRALRLTVEPVWIVPARPLES